MDSVIEFIAMAWLTISLLVVGLLGIACLAGHWLGWFDIHVINDDHEDWLI